MFGIDDPFIILPYLLSVVCVVFAVWFGLEYWNKDDEKRRNTMNTFTLGLIVVAYLLSLAYLGFLGYKKTTSASDYLVGGRQMNPIVMVLSYGATFISASAIVGFGGVAAAFGMGIQWLCFLNMFIGVVIAFIFFGLRTRRMGVKLNVSTLPKPIRN